MTDITKYIVIIIAKAWPDGAIKEGSRLVVSTSEYGPTCYVEEMLNKQPVLFDTFEEAERTAKEWQPHPWYVEKKSYEIVKVRPVYKQVLAGWEKTGE